MKKNGFTLLETLVALVITMAAAFIVNMSWSGNNLRVRKAALNNNIAQLLARKMTEMEAKYRNKPITEITDEEGDFGEEFANYRWSFKVQPFEMPDITPLIIGDKKTADQTLLTLVTKLREALNKAIVEGTVTVSVVVNQKEVNHSVTTYFIDFENEPNLTASP